MVDKPFEGLKVLPLEKQRLSEDRRMQIEDFLIALERDSLKGLFAGTCRMFCSKCFVRHPAANFLESERRKNPRRRVCSWWIGKEGVVMEY